LKNANFGPVWAGPVGTAQVSPGQPRLAQAGRFFARDAFDHTTGVTYPMQRT